MLAPYPSTLTAKSAGQVRRSLEEALIDLPPTVNCGANSDLLIGLAATPAPTPEDVGNDNLYQASIFFRGGNAE